jgi:acetolactate synthase I/II/III large subunit
MKTMPTHADVMATALAKHGVEFVFGLPGGEITAFIDASRRAGMRFLLTGHESSAAIMAQVVGDLTGVPGVCAATLGPGATNLVTGVANAWLDRSPVLAVTAQIPAKHIKTMTHQRLDLTALFSPITKRSMILGERNTEELTCESLQLARQPRPGPVHLTLPSDVALAECTADRSPRTAIHDTGSNSATIAEIASRIASSRRPLLIFGLGIRPAAAQLARRLADALAAPFLVTPKAKGILPEDDPRFLGVASGMAIDGDVLETIRSSDLLIAVGFDPVECDKTWFAEIEIVSVDSAVMTEGDYTPGEAVGDLPVLLLELIEKIEQPKPWPKDLVRSRRRAIVRSGRSNGAALSPLELIDTLRSAFPKEGMVACDVGSHKLIMGQFWKSYEPGTFLMSNGLSGMGFGLPAAMAAQLVLPKKPVLAVVGDGGMLMMLHDLVLIRELHLPITVVVCVDNSLSLIHVSMERRGFVPCGVDFKAPNFAALASGFGIRGERVTRAAEARRLVEEASERREPLVIEVPVDYREYYELV